MSIIKQGFESADLDVPVVLPTLNLDFANSQSLDKRITFSRGSIGTRVNRNGLIETIPANQPRFDFDPISGECRGLLIEESRVNSWLYSGQNVTTGWSFTPTTISFDNTQTAPDGSTNTIKFTERAIYTGGMGFSQTLSVTSGTSYTFSIFAKQPDNSPLRYLSILLLNTGFGEIKLATFNPKNGAVLYTTGTLTTSVQKYPNGWWRFSVTGTATVTTTSQFSVRFTNSISFSVGGGPYGNYTGDGSSFLYFYGPQVENGAFMTSFIPTTASTVTRSADRASMGGTNFSSWYNQSEGSIVTTYQKNSTVSGYNFGVFSLTSSLSDRLNVIDFFPSSFTIYYNGNPQVYEFGGPFNITTKTKSAFSFTTNKFFKCTDGTFYSTSNAVSIASGIKIPTVNTLVLGPYWGGVQPLNGTISRIAYYPKALSPAELQYLTQ